MPAFLALALMYWPCFASTQITNEVFPPLPFALELFALFLAFAFEALALRGAGFFFFAALALRGAGFFFFAALALRFFFAGASDELESDGVDVSESRICMT